MKLMYLDPRVLEADPNGVREEAGNVDIVKGTLALALLRRRLEDTETDGRRDGPSDDDVSSPPRLLRTRDCFSHIEESYRLADKVFAPYLRVLSKEGWESPARFMFGRVHMRADWPLAIPAAARSTGATANSSSLNATGTAIATTSSNPTLSTPALASNATASAPP